MTATVATAASPLVTFIDGGVSYAVWVVDTGTTTPDTGVTATVTFDGTTMAISNLTGIDANNDLLITTRQSTGAEQTLADADVDVIDAPITITITAASAVTVNTINAEGSLNLDTLTNITATTVIVEGGVSGTAAPAAGESLNYGSISAGGLTINVVGAGVMGDLIVNGSISGDITITGGVGRIIVGESGTGQTGNIDDDADITVTGALGGLTVDGNVNGSVSATTIGNVQIGGNLGNAMTNNESITATTGNVGNIFVVGTIGADAAGQTISIVSATGSVGNIVAAGDLGASAAATGTTIITAATNVGDVKSISGNVGDANSPVVVTATAGTIGTVSAGGSYGINGTITARGDITAVTATYIDSTPLATEGIVTGTITSIAGDIGTVSTIEANISATITATSGDIDAVTVLDGTDADTILNTGDVSGNITAGGDVDAVAGAAISGDTSATLGTTGSPVTTWTVGNVTYTLDATAGPIHNYTYTGGAVPSLTDTIDNWDGSAVLTTDPINLSLTTTAVDTDGATILSDAQFDLASLDFDNATVTNGGNTLGTLLVEGDVTGTIDLGIAGSMANLIVEGDVTVPVRTTSVSLVAVGSALGIDAPTLAEMEAMFIHPTAGTVTFAAPANGTVVVPVSANSGADNCVSLAIGDGGTPSHLVNLMTLTAGSNANATDTGATYNVTIADGVVTALAGEGSLADGDVTIIGDLAYMLYGTDLDTVTITGSITDTGGIRANDIGAITVGTVGVLTSGDMAGVISSTDVTDGAFAGLNGAIASLTVYGDLSGSVYADSTIGAIVIGQQITTAQEGDQATGSFTGSILARGTITSIQAQIDIGGSGIIMTGGNLGNVTATDGDVTADIFTGGTIGTITGVNFGGDWLFGAVAGANDLSIVDKAAAIDAAPRTYTINVNAADLVRWDIDADTGITSSGLTIDEAVFFAEAVSVAGSSNDDASVNINEIALTTNATPAFSVTLEGALGNVIAADGNATLSGSDATASAFLTAYNTDEAATVTGDVVDTTNLPSVFDAALNGVNNVALTITLNVDSAGNIVSSGDLEIANLTIASIGDMISLNGYVDLNTMHVATSVGSIVANEDITGDIVCGGPVAIGTVIDLSGYGTAISGGVPSWFAGGILTEFGDLNDVDIVAKSAGELVGGLIVGPTDDALGAIYVLTGDIIDSQLDVFGNFTGIQAPFADIDSNDLTVNVEGEIDMLIIPDAYLGQVTGINQDATVEALNGETVVTVNNSYKAGDTEVEVSGGVAAIVDNNDDSEATIEQITVVGLGAAGTTMDVTGDVTRLDVIGDLAGTITVSGIDADSVNGEVGALNVSGEITATAGFLVYNYGEINAEGGIAPSLVETGTLTKADSIKTVGNTSMYLKGGGSTEADYEALFGKITGVVLSGKGSATLVAVEGPVTTVSEFNDIIKDAQAGNLPAGSANIGDVVVNSSKLQLKNMVVQGDVDSVSTAGKINGLFVSGDVDWLHAAKINNVEINGDVNTVEAYETAKISIAGDVNYFFANRIKSVDVFGTTNSVTLTGTSARMVNSVFSLYSLTNSNVIGINNPTQDIKDIRGWAKVIRSTC